MSKLNIDFLINTPVEKLEKNINSIFNKVVQEIELYLELEAIEKNIKISLINSESRNSEQQIDVFSIGVNRVYENDALTIFIFRDYTRFIPIIALREAYLSFIPKIDDQINKTKIIDVFINQKVTIDLKKLSSMKEWNSIITDKLVDYEFMSGEYDRLENFLKQGNIGDIVSPFKFFIKYVRKNFKIIMEQQDSFYDTLFDEYLLISSKSLFDDDIIETIRILDKIFNRVQYYTAILDYQHYFTVFKEIGFIQTNLSLKKFTDNMKWIKNFSYISPNYGVNWPALNLYSINCSMKFNPMIKHSKVNQIIKELPFFLLAKENRTSFGSDIDGFFVIPKIYFNDVKRFLEKFEDNGYILQIKLTNIKKIESFVNLNYFREHHNKKTIVNRESKAYDEKYELHRSFDYGQKEYKKQLSLLDWLIIDRVRYVSQTGLNFERKAGTLKLLKADFINEVTSQKKFIDNLRSNLLVLHSSLKLRDLFVEFLKANESFGFFYIKNLLQQHINIFNLVEEIVLKNPSIKNKFELHEYIKKRRVSFSIENNLIFMKSSINKTVFSVFLPLYFSSKKKFEELTNRFITFYKIINSFYQLKIFNLQSISAIAKNKSLLDTIFSSKEQKLKNFYENYHLSEINYHSIEEKLKDYLNNDPPVISPSLTANIITTKSHFYIMLLKNNLETIENLKRVRYISKRTGGGISNEMLYFGFYIPYLKGEEKGSLISIIANIFKDNLVNVKRYLGASYTKAFTRKDFFDLERKEFFYTKDLFDQYFLNVRSVFGEAQKPLPEVLNTVPTKLWSKNERFFKLIKSVEDRVRSERVDLDQSKLLKLVDFNKFLKDKILDLDGFKKSYEKFFIQNYVKSIDFFPSFQNFGMSQYSLYLYPTDINKIDFKLLLNNTFQSIKYPAQIDNSNSFLIHYIYPYRNPGISPYINWLTKSKKIIREYCLFFVKKFYQILHFNYNLTSEGWDLDPNRFKIYFQNILFNPDYKLEIPDLKEFNIGDVNSSNYLGPNSSEFKALSQIYSWKSLDIKSYLTRRYFKINTSIMELLKKGLIQPFLSLKNIDVVEEITIILPDVKEELNESILKIFNFFNIGFIYQMEGEYFIHGFDEVIKFENGIMIKLYFPDCQIDEFEKLFDLLFEYMEIDHYLILNDLVDGKNLIKSTFKGLKFLETYNPLTNLFWNDKDKKWRNHKLFNENFEPVYPDMFFGKNNYDLDS